VARQSERNLIAASRAQSDHGLRSWFTIKDVCDYSGLVAQNRPTYCGSHSSTIEWQLATNSNMRRRRG
jgi:hypothetical protein